jgi:hypothetical protein
MVVGNVGTPPGLKNERKLRHPGEVVWRWGNKRVDFEDIVILYKR